MTAAAIAAAPARTLAECLRPAGYFNVKARRLQAACRAVRAWGGMSRMARWNTARLREELLAVHGVGPETADDILLYAFERPVFVIDAYTRRLFARLGFIEGREPYEQLRALFEDALPPDAAVFGEYHALIVAHAKDVCRARPVCSKCVLQRRCPGARAGS